MRRTVANRPTVGHPPVGDVASEFDLRAAEWRHDLDASVHVFDPGVSSVFAWHRSHPRFVGLANVGTDSVDVVHHPYVGDRAIDLLAPDDTAMWRLAPLQVRWITADAAYATVPAPHGHDVAARNPASRVGNG